MVSWRGVLGIVVGGLVFAVGVWPEAFPGVNSSSFLRIVLPITGAIFIFAGVRSIRFVLRRVWVVQTQTWRPAEVEIFAQKLQDSTQYKADIAVDGHEWRIVVDGDQMARRLTGVGPVTARVWLDPKSLAPVAIEIEGKQLNTVPEPTKLS